MLRSEWSRQVVVAAAVATGLVVGVALTGCGQDSLAASAGARVDGQTATAAQQALHEEVESAVAQGPGTHRGAHGGQVEVTQGGAKPLAGAQLTATYRMRFDGYSNAGAVALDGEVVFEVGSAGESQYRGALELTGDYEGHVDVEVHVEQGRMTGSLRLSDGGAYALDVAVDAQSGSGLGVDARNVSAVQARLDSRIRAAAGLGTGTHGGGRGTVAVTQGAGADGELHLAFDGYSAGDGVTLDGQVTYHAQATGEIAYEGELQVEGEYRGHLQFEMHGDTRGRMEGTVTLDGDLRIQLATAGLAIDALSATEVQATLSQRVAAALQLGEGSHAGSFSGQVTVRGEAATAGDGEQALVLTFHNYSVDGELFLDGTVRVEAADDDRQTMAYQGELSVSGRFDGELSIDVTVDAQGAVRGTLETEAGAVVQL